MKRDYNYDNKKCKLDVNKLRIKRRNNLFLEVGDRFP
jgi:hypothetical protein